MNDERFKYIRWAIEDLLRGNFESAKRCIKWAEEEEE